MMQTDFDFDGKTYEPQQDKARLNRQLQKVFNLMKDGQWRTLRDISWSTAAPESSISARLRDLRKERFGNYAVERRRVEGGLFEYALKIGEVRHEVCYKG